MVKKFKPSEPVNLNGTSEDDKLRGSEGADSLFGLGGDDQLRGYGGPDFLFGGEGNDQMWGGSGADNYNLFGSGNDVVIEKVNEGIDWVAVDRSYALPKNVENLIAGFFTDSVVLSDEREFLGNSIDNVMIGSTLENERILGLDGNDTLWASGNLSPRGNDTLDGGNGDDVLIQNGGISIGGAGADVFISIWEQDSFHSDRYLLMPDFNGAEGDLFFLTGNPDLAALFESGSLRFDAEKNQLISSQIDEAGQLYLQTFDFGDVTQFDLAWLTAVDPAWTAA